MPLPLNFLSLVNLALSYKVSGTGSVILRCYDSANWLAFTSPALTSATFANCVATEFSKTFSPGLYVVVEIECLCAPGDTATIGFLRCDANVQ